MPALLLIIALGVGYLVLRNKKVTIESSITEEPFGQPQDIFPDAEPAGDGYYAGQTLYHKETGEKVEVLRLPAMWDGEATIRWADGSSGLIHHSSLKEFFE